MIQSLVCLCSRERETVGYQYRAAPGTAITDNRDNDTPVQSQSERAAFFVCEPSQAMRAADREPTGGEIPVELVSRQPFDDFPLVNRGVEDKWIYLLHRRYIPA